ncbi:MAG: hypothetical protein ACM3WV_01070 [Bacillota bacterium]
MKKFLLVFSLAILFSLASALPASAAGIIDELFGSSEWWPKEGQAGDLELNNFGLYEPTAGFQASDIYSLSWHQVLSSGNSVSLNCLFLNDDEGGFQVYNFTWKTGTPDSYMAFGASALSNITLPHVNVGRKLKAGDGMKVVLDVDAYSLLFVNIGKVEAGLELSLADNVQYYGGLQQPFMFGGTDVERIDALAYQIGANMDFDVFYIDANLYSFMDATDSFVSAEFGVNLGSLAVIGRVGSIGSEVDEAGLYSIGIRFNF